MPKKKEVKEEVKEKPKDLCECKHAKDLHYGGPKGWCNACPCSEFK